MENLESELLDAKLVRLNKEYDDLEKQQQDKGAELRDLRERSKAGEDVASQIDALREEIQEIDSELDGAHKRIRKTEANLKEQSEQGAEQKTELPNEQEQIDEKMEGDESKLSPEDEKFINAKITEDQKEFSDEIKRTLDFLYERNNERLNKIVSDDSFAMLDRAKGMLKDDEFDIEKSSQALDIIRESFENPVPMTGSVSERSESLDQFASRCVVLMDSLEKYQNTVIGMSEKKPELRELLLKIIQAKEAVAEKMTRTKLDRGYLN
jgi:chromosome segregation ATPase